MINNLLSSYYITTNKTFFFADYKKIFYLRTDKTISRSVTNIARKVLPSADQDIEELPPYYHLLDGNLRDKNK